MNIELEEVVGQDVAMNIELDEVVLLDVSDDELEMAAGGAQGGARTNINEAGCWGDINIELVLAIADR